MKEVKVTWIEKKKSISQVYNSGLEYAFLTENFEMIHQLVYCKDFMQDAIAGLLNNKTMSIYGFSYDPKNNLPIYLKKTRLLITNYGDKTFPNRIDASKEFLNQVEKKLKMVRTQIYKDTNVLKNYSASGAFVYDGSSRWMISPPMISLYTLLIRISLAHKPGTDFMETIDGICNGQIQPIQTDDKNQLSKAKKALNWILEKTDKNLFSKNRIENYNNKGKEIPVHEMHNNFGIVSYAYGTPKNYFPEWYKGVEL